MDEALEKQAESFLRSHPGLRDFDLLIADMNGVFRGKRVSREKLLKICREGMYLPASVFAMDVNGETMEETGFGISSGDSDRLCKGIPDTLKSSPWQPGIGQMMMAMEELDGTPFFGNPREVLLKLVRGIEKKGLHLQAAFELEFYLIRSERSPGLPPELPLSLIREHSKGQLYALSSLEICDELLKDIREHAEEMGIPANTSVAELAPGQFEVNLHHVPDPVLACEHAMLLKQVVRGDARNHGLNATFMAKPFLEHPGNGMHVHLSLYDDQGANQFAAEKDGSVSHDLRFSLAGILDLLSESMIFYAPHANSYHRFEENSYAPSNVSWGHDNRTTALRIPASAGDASRIEHRLAGADANPYLVMTVLLAGLLHGLAEQPELQAESKGNAYLERDRSLPASWESSLREFETGSRLASLLGMDFSRLYTNLKRGEQKRFQSILGAQEYDWYLNKV
ncbi:MAG: glutamine synthetase family protein [SAR324 cluster bacterium]|nr:glutamine synthetase family protein [SAR324 cluster bacterium]